MIKAKAQARAAALSTSAVRTPGLDPPAHGFYGSTYTAELHWYEAARIGRKEFKIKHLL